MLIQIRQSHQTYSSWFTMTCYLVKVDWVMSSPWSCLKVKSLLNHWKNEKKKLEVVFLLLLLSISVLLNTKVWSVKTGLCVYIRATGLWLGYTHIVYKTSLFSMCHFMHPTSMHLCLCVCVCFRRVCLDWVCHYSSPSKSSPPFWKRRCLGTETNP